VIPPWLQQANAAVPVVPGRPGRRSFLEKTLQEGARFLEETFFSDQCARRPGLLQGIEPRCKLLATLALLVMVSLARTPALVWGVCLLALLLAAASHIDVGFFCRRVWLIVPIFSLLIILPASLNIFTPGEPLWIVAHLPREVSFGPYRIPAVLAVTGPGVKLVLRFVGRVGASVSLAFLLTLTTPWGTLLAALRGLRVPAIFVMTVAMAYRYVFQLVGIVTEMLLARQSRTVRYQSTSAEQRWVAGRIGHLFSKSLQLSRDVHDAMLARGFSGELRSLARRPPLARDYAWTAGALLLGSILLVVERQLLP
jgi:cobalt/nickel transport system permease protein